MNKFLKIYFPIIIAFVLFSCQKEEPPITTEENPQKPIETVLIKDSMEVENELPVPEKLDLPFEIEGNYSFTDDVANCQLELKIFYEKGKLKYILKTNSKTVSDEAEISKEENGNYYITFQNIKWSENKGFIDPEGIKPEEELPLPTEIMAGLRDNQIIFQNYGNAENYFVILKECDVKYIFFEKI